MSDRVSIAPLRGDEYAAWLPLARGYKTFYGTPTTDEEFAAAWARLHAGDAVQGLSARLEGRMVGIAHYLFHASAWAPKVCYLQDLFTAPEARGRGVARALIEAVAEASRRRGATRYYWLTQEHNKAARLLYDKVAQYKGFIRYDFPL
ncbi:MAG TPA: GNAT family N-acetyltransferase [Burkholderiales bacterium]|nr:GNAT family N-acetyltransferase [Burkholderiales bacterium]